MEGLTRSILRVAIQTAPGSRVLVDRADDRVTMTMLDAAGDIIAEAEDDDEHRAACKLAEAVGVDLLDG